MFDKEAIQELAQAEAISAAQTAVDEASQSGASGFVALPNEFTMHDLERHMPMRRRLRGTMKTGIIDDFAAYVQRHAETGATVFIGEDRSATAVLNLGTPDCPGHADNTARLALPETAPFKALLKVTAGPKTQTDMAEFLEDWSDLIRCQGPINEGGDEATTFISNRQAVGAVRRLTIEAASTIETAEGQLQAQRSALESVKASGGGNPLPAFVIFTCDPYQGLPARTFWMRLSVQTGGQKPMLLLRVIAPEKHAQEMADEMVGLVSGAIGEGLPCLAGSYSPAV